MCVGTTATHVSAGPPTTLHLFPPEASRAAFFRGFLCLMFASSGTSI